MFLLDGNNNNSKTDEGNYENLEREKNRNIRHIKRRNENESGARKTFEKNKTKKKKKISMNDIRSNVTEKGKKEKKGKQQPLTSSC